MCYGLYPTKEVATRGKEHAKQEDAHGSEAPRHLGDTDVTSTIVDFRRLRDVRPRSRYTNTYGDTRHQESRQQHGEIHTEHHQQHTGHIDQQVIGEDKLTPVLVCQEAANNGTDGSTKAIGRDEVQPAQVYLRQSEIVLPQRQAGSTSHNSTGIQIIRQRHSNRALQTSTICHNCQLSIVNYLQTTSHSILKILATFKMVSM